MFKFSLLLFKLQVYVDFVFSKNIGGDLIYIEKLYYIKNFIKILR